MDNLKCLSAYVCDNLNKEDAIVFIDLIDACETLHKELSNSLKIAKKFKEELNWLILKKRNWLWDLTSLIKRMNFWEIKFPLKMKRWRVWNKS